MTADIVTKWRRDSQKRAEGIFTAIITHFISQVCAATQYITCPDTAAEYTVCVIVPPILILARVE